MKRILSLLIILVAFNTTLLSQINTNRVMMMGRNALYYEDYVLAIQRFNSVISAKPYLSDPYFFRGLAKFYLEDYAGAESDCTLALNRSPFNAQYYTLRALCRVNMEHYSAAIEDYKASLEQNPIEKNNWHNMVICYMEMEQFNQADSALNKMIELWPRESSQCTMKAQVSLAMKDTVLAEKWVDKALVLDKYDGGAWSMKSAFQTKRREYDKAEKSLNNAITQRPRLPMLYVNRALVRFHQQNIRGAMSDYDQAIEIDGSNYVAHYNRGLLRAQVGDDNNAIEDFNYVLSVEPDNMIALYNRAILLDRVGDYHGAIEDISSVIDEYPQFWAGYSQRASILRKVGDVYGAERDEYRVLKAKMEVKTGTYKVQKTTRKKEERNIEDYNKMVVDDEQSQLSSYASEFRGRVQNKQTELKCLPMYTLGYYRKEHTTRRYIPYSKALEDYSMHNKESQKLLMCSEEISLDSARISMHQSRITQDIILGDVSQLVMDYYIVRDFESAMSTLDSIVVSDRNISPFYHFMRAQVRTAQIEAQPINENELRIRYMEILQDLKYCDHNIQDFAYASYNMGNTYVKLKDYQSAINSYSRAIEIDNKLPEAYFNRGITYILMKEINKGLADLSQAGEMGLYQAYNLIKKYSQK